MIIKNPGRSNPGFRLMRRRGQGYETVRHADLDAINKELRHGLSRERGRLLVETLRARLENNEKKPPSWLPENQAVADLFIAEHLAAKQNKRPKAARDRVLWAIKQMGSVPIISSTNTQIVTALSHLDNNARRRALAVINSILKYKGIAMRVPLPKREKREIDYLTPAELMTVLDRLTKAKPEWALLALAAFGTGARYGELFALEVRDLRNNGAHIHIGWQRLKDWSKVPTKNDKEGTAFVVPEFRSRLADWLAVEVSVKKEMRRKELPGEYFREACEAALGRSLTFHNLRHSYAHHMLEQGADLIKLKKWMRDRMSTIEDYYLKWVQADSELQGDVTKFG